MRVRGYYHYCRFMLLLVKNSEKQTYEEVEIIIVLLLDEKDMAVMIIK